jgi:hypothetical protein
MHGQSRRLFSGRGSDGRPQGRGRSAWRCGNYLDLLFFGFLGFAIAPLLTFWHMDLLVDERD